MHSKIESQVLAKVKPNKKTISEVNQVADELKNKLTSLSNNKFKPILVGSVPKGTYLENPDIDMFLLFPQNTSREELKEIGLRVGKKVLEDTVEKYAEHPYAHGKYKGFDVDIVPCFDVEDVQCMKSSVDRTPLHTDHIMANLKEEQKDQVILLKAFLKGIGVYSAENRIRGFSGYLCELLILEYGDFTALLEEAKGWKSDETICSSEYGFQEPLVVADPVDPRRNVASALSEDNFYLFVYASKSYLENPDEKFFFPKDVPCRDVDDMLKQITSRGTYHMDIFIPSPDVVEDNLFPQVQKARRALKECLERNDFSLLHHDYYVEKGTIHIIFELEYGILPSIKKHAGPPIDNPHTKAFEDKYGEKVYIEGGRLMVDRNRKIMTPERAVKEAISTLDMGSDLNDLFVNHITVITDGEIAKRFPWIMSKFLNKKLPWNR
ncbi:MAG: CCA tRNA nucleotidyltransferase [Thermoplasmata archaeon]